MRIEHFTGLIEPQLDQNEEIEMYTDVMKAVYPVTRHWAQEIYGGPGPEFQRFREDYLDWKKGKLAVEAAKDAQTRDVLALIEAFESMSFKDVESIDILASVEESLLPHMALLIGTTCRKFMRSHMSDYEYDDFFQEGMLSYLSCVWAYNGISKFCTYLVTSLENRFIDMLRIDNLLSPICPKVADRCRTIKKMQSELEITFEEAVARLELSSTETLSVIRAMSEICRESQQSKKYTATSWSLDELHMGFDASFEDAEEAQELMQAYRDTELDPFERALFEAHFRDEPMASVARQFNSKLGKPYTRCRAMQVFEKAKKKVHATYLAKQRNTVRLRAAA